MGRRSAAVNLSHRARHQPRACSCLNPRIGFSPIRRHSWRDSIDLLGDAIVYGFSLYVVGRGAAWQARAAVLKGTSWLHLAW